jgi:glycosyltransferase involved in cell wall biosynthesis
MRVLQICLKPPVPEVDGGCKAMNNITQGLIENNNDVKVLTLSTHKHPFKLDLLPEEYKAKTKIENVFINTKINFVDAFLNLFSNKSYNIERFNSKNFEELILKSLNENKFEIIFLESLFVSKYVNIIKDNTSAKIIYRAHNIESEIWERNAKREIGFKKWYIKLLAKRLKRHEQNVINHFDGIAAITENDKNKLLGMGCKIPIEVIPFGIDIKHYSNANIVNKNSLFHIGSMDWKPNEHGIKWFLENVWNLVINQFQHVEFNLAGKNMPSWLLNHRQKNVNIHGEVNNAIEFINQNAIMIVPLFSGSGMRIKIIEGMALGRVVIATSIAAEGINYQSGENIIIANTPKEFVDAIVKCLTKDSLKTKIGANAKKMIVANYDNKVIVNNLVEFFKHII